MLSSSSDSEDSVKSEEQRDSIRDDLSKMSFEEIMKLKEELGAKLYNEAVLGVDNDKAEKSSSNKLKSFKRLNKNRPRELTAKRQVPFVSIEQMKQNKTDEKMRDPRFDENCGDFNVKHFKENYKFLSRIRQKDILKLRKQLRETTNSDDRKSLQTEIQKLVNKNVEERKWHIKQQELKREKLEIKDAIQKGLKPHYKTKKERRAKELVTQFEKLKESGKLNKHLEKRRKKNAAKDRKQLGIA
ncbi:PREDICTED: ribosomal RNA processing protein 36 homolog [Bactrocera latifrons]|uniref:rRNA biogenesis protein RRP36 n=1 Tax=Bactrocera latifrons TaxID=174628 RepID=A0A0K8W198_BACLA|nr:PREDICTED: ribosomal RNA processing protein 36 homolog [Bactrocera latifrons]